MQAVWEWQSARESARRNVNNFNSFLEEKSWNENFETVLVSSVWLNICSIIIIIKKEDFPVKATLCQKECEDL